MRRLLHTLVFACLLAAPLCWAGTMYVVTMQSPRGTTTYNVWSDGQRQKVQVVQSTDPTQGLGVTIITRDKGTTMEIVDSQRKMVIIANRQEYQTAVKRRSGPMAEGASEFSMDDLGETDGGMIAGLRTRHHKYAAKLIVDDGTQETKISVVQELWVNKESTDPDALVLVFRNGSTGLPAIDDLMATKDLKGLPLKRVTEAYTDGQFVGRTIVEVKSVQPAQVTEEMFAYPPDFVVKNLNDLLKAQQPKVKVEN